MVVIDEAYIEFVTADDREGSLAIQKDHDNVVVLRTFSKIYGLCGLRTGYGICAPEVKAAIDKVRQPFNVNLLGQLAAIEALKHQDQVAQRREINAALRDLMVERLAERGRATVPSQANFMLVDMNDLCDPHDKVCGTLLSMGAIVRDGNALGCPGWARVTVGTQDEIEFFLDKLASLEVGPCGRELSMMVIMHEAATEQEVAHVCARVEEVGASAHISLGEDVTVIGVIGDREEITELPLEAMPGVDRVVAILRPYKLVSREFQRRDTVIDVERRQDRRRALRPHRRPVLRRDAGAGAGGRPGRQGGRRPHDARRRLQAAHLALRLPGARRGGPRR